MLSQLLAAGLPDPAGARGCICRLGRPQLDRRQHVAREVAVVSAAAVALMMMICSRQRSALTQTPLRVKK
jgi:hypothetical protein